MTIPYQIYGNNRSLVLQLTFRDQKILSTKTASKIHPPHPKHHKAFLSRFLLNNEPKNTQHREEYSFFCLSLVGKRQTLPDKRPVWEVVYDGPDSLTHINHIISQ